MRKYHENSIVADNKILCFLPFRKNETNIVAKIVYEQFSLNLDYYFLFLSVCFFTIANKLNCLHCFAGEKYLPTGSEVLGTPTIDARHDLLRGRGRAGARTYNIQGDV